MPEATRPIAVIPSDCFRWQPRVQFIDSFRTRQAALNCAFEHGYNLIVERYEGNRGQFDVLDDPNGACTAGLELELLKTQEILVAPDVEGWASLMLSSLRHLARRLSAAIVGVCAREIVPHLRQTFSRRRRAAFEHAIRHVWSRLARPSGSGARESFWRPPIPARYRIRASSLSAIRLHARRIAARLSTFYHHEFVPFCKSTARRCWWSNAAVALRRGWHRHSQGSVTDAVRRLAAEISVLYGREVTPRLRYALSRCRQADFQGAGRRAWRVTLLAAIRLTDRFAAAVAHFYVRGVAPRLQRAAARYQQADFEGSLRRSMEAVAPPPRSNAS